MVEKIFFRLLNLSMINAFILYSEWLKMNSNHLISQHDFPIAVIIKQLLGTIIEAWNVKHSTPEHSEFALVSSNNYCIVIFFNENTNIKL